MKCYNCPNEASTKIGMSEGNILKALLGKKCWNKQEVYYCKECYQKEVLMKNE